MSEIDRRILAQLSHTSRPDCPTIKALGDFLDQKIDAESGESIEMHLRSCPACINRLIELRELARLQDQGPEPRAALLQEVISMVGAEATSTSTQWSLFGRLAPIFASIRSVATDFRFVLAVGGTVAAAVVAVIFLRSPRMSPRPGGSDLAEESAGAFAERTLSKRIVPAIASVSAGSKALNKHVLAALESLPKTLILEQTRGATDTAVYKQAAPATVLVITDAGLGSGVVISNAGEILTNYHVIRNAKRVVVVFKPKRGVDIKKDLAYVAIPIKVDKLADLALLKVDAPSELLHPLSLVGTSNLEVGDDVHAIGHPEGEVWTYTTGTISQIRPKYEWKEEDGTHRATVIQTQTAINPGNSGGPLLNNKSEVIGINSFRMEGEGLNYAIAGDTIGAFLKSSAGSVAEAPAEPNVEAGRLEPYGKHIAGAYVKSQTPPPDVWFVFTGAGNMPDYAVMGARSKTKLDTVFKGTDPKWKRTVYYFDVNCDGVIDLIGYSSPGSKTIDKYQRPESAIRLDALASQLAKAFDDGTIPYRQVQLCR